MLNTKEQRELDRLLKKQAEPLKPLTENDIEEIEKGIVSVYDRSPELCGDGLQVWRKFCSNLDVLVGHNDRLVREVRRLNIEIEKIKGAETN